MTKAIFCLHTPRAPFLRNGRRWTDPACLQAWTQGLQARAMSFKACAFYRHWNRPVDRPDGVGPPHDHVAATKVSPGNPKSCSH